MDGPGSDVAHDLNSENRQLRAQLQGLVEVARENEQMMRRFNRLELSLLEATALPELLQRLLYQTREAFGLACVTLTLLDPEAEFTRILNNFTLQTGQMPELIIDTDPGHLSALYHGQLQPQLGDFLEPHHARLFPVSPYPSSVATLPLLRQQTLLGSLNLGSMERDHYCHECGTEFLSRLARVVAVCLENSLNQERLKLAGVTDPLTQVKNRRYFDQRLDEELRAASRHHHPLVCMFIDADHFKQVNDELGHAAGDAVLQRLAAMMGSQLRVNDILCRYGGEEFVALLTDTPLPVAQEIAERIRQLVAGEGVTLSDGNTLNVTVSIGIAALAAQRQIDATSSAHSLLAAADAALYQAKRNGRNRVECAPLLEPQAEQPA